MRLVSSALTSRVRRSGRAAALALAASALALSALACRSPRPESTPAGASGPAPALGPATLITNVSLLDGTGAPARPASVRVVGDRIDAVGAAGALAPRAGEQVVNGRGLVLAPGFIDTHSHADDDLFEHRDALAVVSQGVTTVVVGQDGGSPFPLADFFARVEREPPTVNVASYAGHGTLRERVMGEDFRRTARPAEVDSMRALLRTELAGGALGLSSGLEYDPGIYSSRDELIALAKEASAVHGRYISHVRSEDRAFWAAIDELVAIGREAHLPVQLSHAKLAMRSLWGHGDSLIRVLDRARAAGVNVTADLYPYTYWQSTLTVLFPERNFDDRAAATFALTEVSTPAGLLLGRFDPDSSYVGKTVADISRLRGTDSVTTLIALIHESLDMAKQTGRETESVIGTSMDDRDVERIMRWPYANVCSDGELAGRHPRGFGTFPRVLARYVRERQVLTLPEAVRKMTSLAAANVGIRDRGVVRAGAYADLVLFDPATVLDRATPTDPRAVSQGIARVWVNGREVWRDGTVTEERPGRVIRRTDR
jgi:N-acyl-D-amino-acid deacylase